MIKKLNQDTYEVVLFSSRRGVSFNRLVSKEAVQSIRTQNLILRLQKQYKRKERYL